MKKETFYLTFGQKYPWRNGWVEVLAYDYVGARQIVEKVFGRSWGWLYQKHNFEPKHFPAGKLGETME